MFKKTVLTLLTLSSFFGALSAEVHTLTLDACVELAKLQSNQMLIYEAEYMIAKYNFEMDMSVFKPQLSYSGTQTFSSSLAFDYDYAGERSNRFTNRNSHQSELKFSQYLPTDGRITFNPNLDIFNSTTTAESYGGDRREVEIRPYLMLDQPLQALYGYNSYRNSKINYELEFEIAERRFSHMEQMIKLNVGDLYLNVAKYSELLKVQEQLLTSNKQLLNKLKTSENTFSTTQKLKLLIIKNQTQYGQYKSAYIATSNALKEYLNLSMEDSITVLLPTIYSSYDFKISEITNRALDERYEINRDRIYLEKYALVTKRLKSYRLPKADFFAGVTPGSHQFSQKDDVSYFELLGDAMDDSFDKALTVSDLSLGLSLRVPILDGKRNKSQLKVQEARIDAKQFEQELHQNEIIKRISTLVLQIENTASTLDLIKESTVLADKDLKNAAEKLLNGSLDARLYIVDTDLWESTQENWIISLCQYHDYVNQLEFESLSDVGAFK